MTASNDDSLSEVRAAYRAQRDAPKGGEAWREALRRYEAIYAALGKAAKAAWDYETEATWKGRKSAPLGKVSSTPAGRRFSHSSAPTHRRRSR